MSKELIYWTSVGKRILFLAIAIIGIILIFKIAYFYLPFVIAFIVSIIIEPIIRFLMTKFKFSRRISSIIVLIITLGIIIGLLIWGIITLISEATNLLSGFNDYYNKINIQIQSIINCIDFSKISIPTNILNMIEESMLELLQKGSSNFQNFLTKFLSSITKIPEISIYFAITILALYFICTDKIYMLDELEHHLPEKWMKKLSKHIRELIKVLGGYLKSQALLILISFIICLIGLYVLYFFGFNVGFPLISAMRHSFCRCSSNTRIGSCYGTMGDFFRIKWRFKTWNIDNNIMDNNVGCKAIYRT